MRRVLGYVSAVLIAVVVLSAGSGGGVDGPVVVGDRRSGGSDAELSGVLVIVDDCLFISWPDVLSDTDGYAVSHPVIWPHETGWDAAAQAVVLPDGTLVSTGDEVLGSGGYYSSDLGRFTSQAGVDRIHYCFGNDFLEVAVFNSSGEIQVRQTESQG